MVKKYAFIFLTVLISIRFYAVLQINDTHAHTHTYKGSFDFISIGDDDLVHFIINQFILSTFAAANAYVRVSSWKQLSFCCYKI